MEYTLEDAFEALKDAKRERVQQIEELLDEISKVDPITFKQTSSPEEISTKQHKLCQSLLTEILQEEPKDYPFPKTSDLHVEALTELQEEVRNAEALHESLKERLSAIEENVSYLENKKLGLEKMEQAYLDHVELNTDRSYVTEHVITKRMFNEVKTDLDQLITKLFPDNQNVRVFLADLTASYAKGGNAMYVHLRSDVLDFASFLVMSDMAMHHRNDKNKIRLMDML
ncbi:PREDICTED: uncharacterized protein LOC107187360 isoform X2 [Dufourea novaeangliae]|uniref:uncharacterized protein LOC107187360 isoform X2 n=1 Tax=Dufourea novaeangliae TaxID=178035 RepID=UPI000766E24F|nr:PREDICTED: uncharacterized protein LOC107187360 isoform X2 [Dufourea novaeangliae]